MEITEIRHKNYFVCALCLNVQLFHCKMHSMPRCNIAARPIFGYFLFRMAYRLTRYFKQLFNIILKSKIFLTCLSKSVCPANKSGILSILIFE